MKNSHDIRQSFLNYFNGKGHVIVPSSPLVPANDPTLLFTSAGMVQFKDVFLGKEKRDYQRAVSVQRCVRAGGKHNDLENVGYTARHHTFFEMLGNFSFGDYFKQDAINYAWCYLTNILNIPEEKLWVSVFADDDETAEIWLRDIGISAKRFSRCGEKDNFWSMGETGPCGPCSEIFYDHGENVPGGPPGSATANLDRYIEIWNLVFTQYDRDENGTLTPIPHPSVDTGMGLERISAIMQGVHNNYEIDTFQKIISAIKTLSGDDHINMISSRVIADHIRSSAFLIADGVRPANEGRGYVLRRIIRRAIRHGHKIGFKTPFFYQLTTALANAMGEAYPELFKSKHEIEHVLLSEETRFAETLEQGLRVLDNVISHMSGTVIPGEDVFKLYDTYGFPVDLSADIAREKNLSVDIDGFNDAMTEQRKRARAASQFNTGASSDQDNNLVSAFTGYERLQQKTTVIGLYQDGRNVTALNQGEVGGIILLETPFYAQSGGQIGDSGELFSDDVFFEVEDTKKQGRSHIHLGVLRTGCIRINDVVCASVDASRRKDIMRNHSATHLLHAALKQVLGDHIMQKGSLVAHDRLRFDFSHNDTLTRQQLIDIERMVNMHILNNDATKVRIMPLDQAKAAGAVMLFGEKYDDAVRVLRIGGDFSLELCGGTHVHRAGDIGLFKIISESSVAAGIKRIEAVTGMGALDWADHTEHKLNQVAKTLKTNTGVVIDKLIQQLEKTRKIEKELQQLKGQFALTIGSDMTHDIEIIAGIKVVTRILDNVDSKTLRDTVDQLKHKLGTAVLVLATVDNNKVYLVAGVTKDCIDKLQAVDLVNFVAKQVGGKGGGRSDMAQAGGNNPSQLNHALAQVTDWVRTKVLSA